MLAVLSQGHLDLADFCFLCATIVFAILFVVAITSVKLSSRLSAALMPLGLGLVALALFVS